MHFLPHRWFACAILPLACASLTSVAMTSGAMAAKRELSIQVAAGKHDRVNTPVSVRLVLPREFAGPGTIAVLRREGDRDSTPAQLASPPLLDAAEATAKEGVVRHLQFVVTGPVKAGETITYRATLMTEASASGGRKPPDQPERETFGWLDTKGQFTELRFGQRPVLRYAYRPLDESSKEAREQTYKIYHHLYSPDGKHLLTKGPGGLFTHHRGLFYGFNRVSYDAGKAKADVWHCSGDAHQSHQGFLATEAGPVLGRHQLKIHWHGPGKKVFAEEQRELTVYHVPGGQLVEFASRLASRAGKIMLDGDPQHAGFHFRAANEVAEKTKQQTYFLRPDGAGKTGATRNWDAKTRDPQSVNLPWNAMSFVVGGERFTAAYLDKPTNPKEARYSERDYGRFGSYFEHTLAEDKALDVNYRLWLQAGEMKVEEVRRLSQDFVEPPQVTVENQ
jgi:hypothetical protein